MGKVMKALIGGLIAIVGILIVSLITIVIVSLC